MNLIKVFYSFFMLILSISSIACTESNIEDEGTYNYVSEDINGYSFETLTGDIDITWGAINDDSVRIGLPIGFTKNASVGTIAAWNVTIIYPRVIDGIRMRSVNNSGAVGDVIAGGIGYNNVTYMFVGKSNYFYFIVDVYENYTSSLITTSTTTRIPNIIIEEWGTINYASNIILPRNYHQVVTAPEQTIDWIIRLNSTVPMDGIRLTSLDDSVASGEITEGGIGYNFATFRVISKAERLNCLIEKFQNGTYTTEQPTTTNFPTTTSFITTTTVLTTQNPEDGEIKEWGKIDSDTKLAEKRFQNYPQPNVIAEKNETLSITGTILGMRLKSLNYTSGLWELIAGGLNESFVTFNFKGDGPGKPYDFNIEIFGNSASAINFSLLVVTLSSIVFALIK